MNNYCSQQQVEGYLGRSLTDEEAVLFPTLEAGMADYIDAYCARNFLSSRAVTHTIDATMGDGTSHPFQRYDGGQEEIFFDQPLQTDTTIKDSNNNALVIAPYVGAYDASTNTWSLLDSTAYTLHPLNSKVKTSAESNFGVFPYGLSNILVYGTFADYLTPPQAIQLAATTLCGGYYNNTDNLKSETIEGYARTFDKEPNPIVCSLLDSYKRVVL